jgi:hypothetical protein
MNKLSLVLLGLFCIQLYSSDLTTYTFKKFNFRLNISPEWEIDRKTSHATRILFAQDSKTGMLLEIHSSAQTKDKSFTRFKSKLKSNGFKITNYSELNREMEFNFSTQDGYLASLKGKENSGYAILARDGFHEILVLIYIKEEQFTDNFKEMKEILKGFSFNHDYFYECCSLGDNSSECKLFKKSNTCKI